MSRRQAREIALQALFQLDFNNDAEPENAAQARQQALDAAQNAEGDTQLGNRDYKFALNLVNGTMENCQDIDSVIGACSKEWKLERMAAVDRNITRLAVYELKYGQESLDAGIIINEAVELAKKYGTDDSSRFVNGILGAIARG